jgi:hypothetical protein
MGAFHGYTMTGEGPQKMHAFESMSELLSYARTGAPLFYKAPMSVHPARLGFSIRYKVGKKGIRITPPKSEGDPFTADVGHLTRFLRP